MVVGLRSWLGFLLTPNLTTSRSVLKAIRAFVNSSDFDSTMQPLKTSLIKTRQQVTNAAVLVRVRALTVEHGSLGAGICPALGRVRASLGQVSQPLCASASSPGTGGGSTCSQACCTQCPIVSSAR